MLKIFIGGVPEHFNLPWHLALEENLFQQKGIDLQWKDYPGGTGAMCEALRTNEIDMAVLLTEGIVADIAKGNTARIIKWYVETPLIWGIHVAGNSKFNSAEELEGLRYAISRYGSGSHLMAFVDAAMRGWKVRPSQLIPVGGLQGAVESITNGEAEIFLWEKFMTKPYVDTGTFKRVGEVPTPWPCFAIAATEEALAKHANAITQIMDVVNTFHHKMQSGGIVKLLVAKYDLLEEDAHAWLQQTNWSISNTISVAVLDNVVQTLQSLNLIDQPVSASQLVCHPGLLI